MIDVKHNVVLTTPRLALTLLNYTDASFIEELVNSPGWLQYIGDRNVHSAADAITYLDKGPLMSYREHGFGLWRVSLNDTGVPIGMCGILRRAELDGPDLGFAFLPAYQRKGYAHEAVQATIHFAQQVLGMKQLLAIVQSDNGASIALLQKNQFRYEYKVRSGANMDILDLYQLDFSLS